MGEAGHPTSGMLTAKGWGGGETGALSGGCSDPPEGGRDRRVLADSAPDLGGKNEGGVREFSVLVEKGQGHAVGDAFHQLLVGPSILEEDGKGRNLPKRSFDPANSAQPSPGAQGIFQAAIHRSLEDGPSGDSGFDQGGIEKAPTHSGKKDIGELLFKSRTRPSCP